MRRGEAEGRLTRGLLDVHKAPIVFWAIEGFISKENLKLSINNILNTGNTLQNKVLSRDRSGLIETTDVDTTSEGDTERLGTKDGYVKIYQRYPTPSLSVKITYQISTMRQVTH